MLKADILEKFSLALNSPQYPFNIDVATAGYRSDITEIIPECLDRVPFGVNFSGGSHPQAAEQWDRWTPALYGMLGQKTRNDRGKEEPAPIDGRT